MWGNITTARWCRAERESRPRSLGDQANGCSFIVDSSEGTKTGNDNDDGDISADVRLCVNADFILHKEMFTDTMSAPGLTIDNCRQSLSASTRSGSKVCLVRLHLIITCTCPCTLHIQAILIILHANANPKSILHSCINTHS